MLEEILKWLKSTDKEIIRSAFTTLFNYPDIQAEINLHADEQLSTIERESIPVDDCDISTVGKLFDYLKECNEDKSGDIDTYLGNLESLKELEALEFYKNIIRVLNNHLP